MDQDLQRALIHQLIEDLPGTIDDDGLLVLAAEMTHYVMTKQRSQTLFIDFTKVDPEICPFFAYAAHGKTALALKDQLKPAVDELIQQNKAKVL